MTRTATRWSKRAVAVLAAGMVVASAGAGGAGAASPGARHAVRGGTAVVGLSAQTSPNWFFPLLSFTADSVLNAQVDSQMYLPLITFDPHGRYDYADSLATGISVNAAGDVYTVHLNPKYHWSDGQPVTASDVLFTWSIMKAASSGSPKLPWTYAGQGTGGVPNDWKSVVAKDPYTVVITTTTPRSSLEFIDEGIAQIVPVPAHVWNKYPGDMTKELAFIAQVANQPNNPVYDVVDGPFKFQSYQANQYWAFVPNPHFDGHKPSIAKLVFKYFASDEAEFLALKTGQVNFGYLPPSMWADRSQLPNDVLFPSYQMGFNEIVADACNGAPGGLAQAFRDQKVLQALQYGVDQEGIVRTVYHGEALPSYSFLVSQPPSPLYDRHLKALYPFDPAKGRRILEADGWRLRNGVMTKNGVKLSWTMYYVSGATDASEIAQILKADWQREGIQVNLVQQPFNEVISYAPSNASKWAMQYWGGGWSFAAYPSLGAIFSSQGSENVGCFYDKTADRLIAATNQPGTVQQQLQRMYAAEEYLARVLPGAVYIPLPASLYEVSRNLKGAIETYSPFGMFIRPQYWTFTQ